MAQRVLGVSALSRILRSVQGDGRMFECPGCCVPHRVWVGAGAGPRWNWNGSTERPTFSPWILVRGRQPLADESHAAWMRGEAAQAAAAGRRYATAQAQLAGVHAITCDEAMPVVRRMLEDMR